ncbi:prolyl oligopeptidase family serine peptidase [Halomicroarcula limicola]|uniref:Prolyl oligopeptidase family serine peptidase n=1 Tax=Haloarcula limicola TaxID=1429915 RepID=A0A8J7Y8K5_9EURY|nr:prolyl oligopeptidase family serine peptidase [Halomicroarcula limicola]MBV0924061.1 prolyl oligopeptidase family serine peptidase [Halomicroarcula limicola]
MSDSETDDVLDALAGLPTLAHPTASPDGTEVAFYYDGSGRNELHVLDVESGEHERWSDGEVPRNARWFLEWGADGDRVFFHRDEGGDEQNDVYAIDREGAVEPVVELDGQVQIMDVSEDGETLLVGSTRDGQMNLYGHDLSGGETAKLTDYERAVWTGLLSPDGDRLAFTTNEADDFENMDVYVSEADGSDPRNLDVGETGSETGVVEWGPDGDRLLLTDNSEDIPRSGVYDVERESVTWYGGEFVEAPQCFLPDGDRFLALRTREASKVPVVYDAESGESRELDLPDGVAGLGRAGDDLLADGRILLTHTTPTRRPSLLAYDLETDETETLLEAEYGPFSPEDFADAEYFTVESDGVPETRQAAVEHDPYETLEIGALLYDSGERPSPLVVNPHGGPRAMDTKSFDLYTQFLAQRGYSVLQVNYRGSTGRGRAFVRALYGDWGGAEQGDVATAAERVLDGREWIDDERVAVFGGSYGGYSAYWQLVQYPDLYDAGVAWIGLTDLVEMYETTMPHFRTELMEKNLGTPEENPELYRERSPVEYVENLAAPLFMLHGVNDRRVPVSQARLFRDALEEAGYSQGEDGGFEYEELGEEGHASSDIDQKRRLFRLLDDFLDRRIGVGVAAADD